MSMPEILAVVRKIQFSKIGGHRGITLVALVVTIIVLIILATVSISALLGDNGIISKGILMKEANAKDVNKKESDLNKTLAEYANTMATDNWPEVIEESYWTYEQATQTVTNGKITLNIGDYVDYDCNSGIVGSSYISESAKNGYADQTFNVADYTKGWRVFGANNSGELLLISEDTVPLTGGYSDDTTGRTCYYLKGKNGYANGINELNNICSIYGKGTGATGAKNATIEDIDNITGYNPKIELYGEGSVGEYENEVTYSLKYYGSLSAYILYYIGTKYPTSEQFIGTVRACIYYEENEWKALGQDESKTLKMTAYKYYPTTLTAVSDDETVGIDESTLAYKMLLIDSITENTKISNYYWLASSYIDSNVAYYYPMYGLRYVSDGMIIGNAYLNDTSLLTLVYGNSGNEDQIYNGVRPVVSLANSVQIKKSETVKNGCTLWNMRYVN